MLKCVFCRHWKRSGYVVQNGCTRFEPHNLPVRGDISVVYWEGDTLSDEKAGDSCGNVECVGDARIRKVCDHPDIEDNKEHVTFTTFFPDGSPHDVDIRPKEEFEATRRKLIEDIKMHFYTSSAQAELEGVCKCKGMHCVRDKGKSERSE